MKWQKNEKKKKVSGVHEVSSRELQKLGERYLCAPYRQWRPGRQSNPVRHSCSCLPAHIGVNAHTKRWASERAHEHDVYGKLYFTNYYYDRIRSVSSDIIVYCGPPFGRFARIAHKSSSNMRIYCILFCCWIPISFFLFAPLHTIAHNCSALQDMKSYEWWVALDFFNKNLSVSDRCAAVGRLMPIAKVPGIAIAHAVNLYPTIVAV